MMDYELRVRSVRVPDEVMTRYGLCNLATDGDVAVYQVPVERGYRMAELESALVAAGVPRERITYTAL